METRVCLTNGFWGDQNSKMDRSIAQKRAVASCSLRPDLAILDSSDTP